MDLLNTYKHIHCTLYLTGVSANMYLLNKYTLYLTFFYLDVLAQYIYTHCS